MQSATAQIGASIITHKSHGTESRQEPNVVLGDA